MTACTTPVAEGMNIENEIKDISELRKSIIELLFVEGNHFCPACEKSGNCELQALGLSVSECWYPGFPYQFPVRRVDASHPKIIKDQNRCILCKRCIRAITDENGQEHFCLSHAEVQVWKWLLIPNLENSLPMNWHRKPWMFVRSVPSS